MYTLLLTKEELTNIISLINTAPIKGLEAITVGMIQVKLNKALENTSEEESKVDGEKKKPS